MFYQLSKLLSFAVYPTFWIFLLIFIAWFSRSDRKRKKYIGIALIIFILFGNQFIFNKAIKNLEYSPTELNTHYKCAIVLGGYGHHNDAYGNFEFSEAADRLTSAVELLKSNQIEKILISSGASSSQSPEIREADESLNFLIRLGIPSENILIENKSRNTFQNAKFVKPILDNLHISEPCLLITSAFHMRRAKACFDNQNIRTVPYPVDFIYEGQKNELSYYLIPSVNTLIDWSIIIKEIIGYWIYDLKGYI